MFDFTIKATGTIQELFQELAEQVKKMTPEEKAQLREAIMSLVPPNERIRSDEKQ
jgi:hypothetical protein